MANDIPLARHVRRLGHLALPAAARCGAGHHAIVGHVKPPHGAPQSNDVDVDTRGLIYLIDRLQGFDILEFDGSR